MRITFLFVVTFFCTTAFSQSKTTASLDKNNEVRLNLFMSAIGYPEISYEHYLKNNTGIGVSASGSIVNKEDQSIYFLSPFYRVYFGSKKALGFFMEGNLSSYWIEHFISYYDTNVNGYGNGYTYTPYYHIKQSVGFFNYLGYGALLGYKFTNKSGIIAEISFGVDRLHNSGSVDYQTRMGISLGKSF